MTINRDAIRADLLKFQTDCSLNDLNVNIPDPRKIMTKLIECYDFQRKASIYSNQVRPIITSMRNQLEIEKFNLNVRRRDILTNVQSVKDQPSARERELATEALLEKENKTLLELQNQINVYEDLFDAIEMTLKQLKTAEQDVKTLIKIMEAQINRLNVGTVDDPEVKGLTQNLSDLDKMANLSEEVGLEDDVESSEEHLQTDEAIMDLTQSNEENPTEADPLVEDGDGNSEQAVKKDELSDFNGGVPTSTQSDTAGTTEVSDSDFDLTDLLLGEDSSDSNIENSGEESTEEVVESNPVDEIANATKVKSIEVVKNPSEKEVAVKQVVVNDLDIDLTDLVNGSNDSKPKTEEKAVTKSVESSRVINSNKTPSKPKVVEDSASVSSMDFDIDDILNMSQ